MQEKAFWRVIQAKCAFGKRVGARVGPYFGALGGWGLNLDPRAPLGLTHSVSFRLRYKDFSSCVDPPPRGVKKFPQNLHTATHLIFWGFGVKKGILFFFGPKMVQKWPKSGQKWPKLPHNRRNNWRGSPRKSQQILKISEKWSKTPPQCKCTKKSKNGKK